MSEKNGAASTGRWVTPHAQAGASHFLSGQALADLARDVITRGLSFRFLAPGTSMGPFIRDGDVITLVPFEAAHCSPGRVVAFAQPRDGRLVVHRIVAVAGDRCRIRGDNASEEDGEFSCRSIIGTVSRVERAGRAVTFGLGPERVLIAYLSRRQWLRSLFGAAGACRSIIRRSS